MRTENLGLKVPGKVETLSATAVARRRALLRGAGKGVAVLGASIPLQTLASTSVFTYEGTGTATQIRCGVSGMTSGIHSRDTDRSNQCYGFSPGYYHLRANFPAGTNPDAPITGVFPTCTLNVNVSSGTRAATLLEVMNITPRPPEFHWLAAWLNAQPNSPAVQYPLTGLDIQTAYFKNDQDVYKFITTYMEKHPGTQYPA